MKKSTSGTSGLSRLKQVIMNVRNKTPLAANSSNAGKNGQKAASKLAPKAAAKNTSHKPASLKKHEAPSKAKTAPIKAAAAEKGGAQKGAPIAAPAPAKKAPRAARGAAVKAPSVVGAARLALEAAGESVCREVACEGLATTAGYCRLHYIKNWKKIKRKELILKEKKLNQYIEELVAKYPDKYIEAIRQDLANDKDFAKVIYDLDLDEGVDDFDVEGESLDSVIDTIKRDFDDEGEGF